MVQDSAIQLSAGTTYFSKGILKLQQKSYEEDYVDAANSSNVNP
jgi:hypothetical protein